MKIQGNNLIFKNKTINIQDVYKALNKATKQAERLSSGALKNALFPYDLGADGEPPKWLRKAVNDFEALIYGGEQPPTLLRSLEQILSYGNNPAKGERAFYNAVREYYGLKGVSTPRLRELIAGGKLHVPAQKFRKGERRPVSDPTRIQKWLIEHVKTADKDKIEDIDDIYALLQYAQHYEATGRAHKDIYNRYANLKRR